MKYRIHENPRGAWQIEKDIGVNGEPLWQLEEYTNTKEEAIEYVTKSMAPKEYIYF